MKALVLSALLALAACSGAPSCAFVRVAEFPVVFVGNLPLVDVTMNGQKVRMVLDTGAEGSLVFESALDKLNLATDPLVRTLVTGVGGISSHNNALVEKLEMGSVSRRNLSISVVAMKPLLNGRTAGLLGNDVLERFDVDLDFPHNHVTLYQQRRCPGGVPDWTTPAEALPRPRQGQALPATVTELLLDGVKQNAVIDTGASFSGIDRRGALASGAMEDALGADRQSTSQGINAAVTAVGAHRFRSMQVGSETIADPVVLVTARPDMLGNRNFGMLLGEEYIRKHRLWIAYGDSQVFVARPPP